MKTKKRYIVYFLMFISMLMLVVPVIPHHHHSNGRICMKNDITPEKCCTNHQQHSCKDHCCCGTGCVTTHFFQRAPSSDDGLAGPDFPLVITLFSEPLLKLLTLPESNGYRQENIYQEKLHGTYLTRATGLRAPPCLLS